MWAVTDVVDDAQRGASSLIFHSSISYPPVSEDRIVLGRPTEATDGIREVAPSQEDPLDAPVPLVFHARRHRCQTHGADHEHALKLVKWKRVQAHARTNLERVVHEHPGNDDHRNERQVSSRCDRLGEPLRQGRALEENVEQPLLSLSERQRDRRANLYSRRHTARGIARYVKMFSKRIRRRGIDARAYDQALAGAKLAKI